MVCEGRAASHFVYQPSFIQEGFFIVLRCIRSYHLLGYTMYTASMLNLQSYRGILLRFALFPVYPHNAFNTFLRYWFSLRLTPLR